MPVATSACVVPLGRLGEGGVIATLRRTAAVTLSVALAVTPVEGSTAVTVVVPIDAAVATPCVPAALEIVATVVLEDAHVTEAVTARVEPSLYVPVAMNACVVPLAMLVVAGVMATLRRTPAVTLSAALPAMPVAGSVAVIVVEPAEAALAVPWEPAAFEMVATAVEDEVHVAAPMSARVVPSV